MNNIKENWSKDKLGNRIKFINGFAFKSEDFFQKGVRLVKISNIQSGKIIFNDTEYIRPDLEVKKDFFVESEDILIAMSGATTGKIGMYLFKEKSLLNQRVGKLKPNNNLDEKYLFFLALDEEFQRKILIDAVGGAQPNISGNQVEKISCDFPPLNEQKKIAEILSSVDKVIELTELEIEKLQNLKKGMMQDLLTKGIGHTKFKDSPLGKIPESWEVKKMDNLVSIETGNKDTQDKIEGGKYPFYVRSAEVERINTYSFDGTAILTVGDGVGTGKVFHYTEGKIAIHQRVYKLADFNSEIHSKFLYYYFSENFIKQVDKYSAKTSVDSVRREMISRMNVPVPTLPEQKKIAEILSSVDNLIESTEIKLNKLQHLKKALMQDLLTGKVRVKI